MVRQNYTDREKQQYAMEVRKEDQPGTYEHGRSEFPKYATPAGTRVLDW